MTAINLEGILEDLKFAAEAGSDFYYELDDSDPDRPFILAMEYGEEGELTGETRIWIEFEPVNPVLPERLDVDRG